MTAQRTDDQARADARAAYGSDQIDHDAPDHDWETCPHCLEQAVKDGILEDARGPKP